MTNPPVPTRYELWRIAAIIKGSNSKMTPETAAKEAMRLWDAVGTELAREQANLNEAKRVGEQKQWVQQKADEKNSTVGMILQEYRANNEQTAMKWISEHAENDADRFKSITGFQKAWQKTWSTRGGSSSVPDDPATWQQFLEHRNTDRRAADAKRKQRIRKLKRPPES